MILCGGNDRDWAWSFNYRVLYKDDYVTIEGGTYQVPLTIYGNGAFGRLTITPLGYHYRRLNVEVIN